MHENLEKKRDIISSNASKPYISVIPTCPDNLLITSKI
jgi:hypothetical protein